MSRFDSRPGRPSTSVLFKVETLQALCVGSTALVTTIHGYDSPRFALRMDLSLIVCECLCARALEGLGPQTHTQQIPVEPLPHAWH